MPPDVTIVSPYPPIGIRRGGRTGVASYTAALGRALSAAGAAVTVVAPTEDVGCRRQWDGGVEIIPGYSRGHRALGQAAATALATGAPVVHIQHEVFAFGGPTSVPGLIPALTRVRRAGRGPVVTLHQVVDASSVDRSFTRLHRVQVPAPFARAALGGLQGAVAGLAAATIVHERGFADHVRGARVIPLGVDPDPPAPARATAREVLGVDHAAFVVLCFGFIAPYKGLELALEAARLAGPPIHLVVAGDEHPRLRGRDPYASRLRARWGAAARFTGRVADADVGAWFAAADVALFPYPRPFSSSGALADALAHRTPVLVSPALADSAGLPPACVGASKPQELARQLADLAADRGRLSVLGEASSAFAAGRWWPAVARRHLHLYEEVSVASRTADRRLRAG